MTKIKISKKAIILYLICLVVFISIFYLISFSADLRLLFPLFIERYDSAESIFTFIIGAIELLAFAIVGIILTIINKYRSQG